MMDGDVMGWMMGGMGVVTVLGLGVIVVIAAAAIKYLFFDKRRDK